MLNRVDQPFWKAAAQAAQAWLQRPLPGPGVPGVPLPRGRLARQALFAGDYTSSGFYGYVGGGLNSGAVLAGRLARRLNLVQSR